jgi:hypothetical protein
VMSGNNYTDCFSGASLTSTPAVGVDPEADYKPDYWNLNV